MPKYREYKIIFIMLYLFLIIYNMVAVVQFFNSLLTAYCFTQNLANEAGTQKEMLQELNTIQYDWNYIFF